MNVDEEFRAAVAELVADPPPLPNWPLLALPEPVSDRVGASRRWLAVAASLIGLLGVAGAWLLGGGTLRTDTAASPPPTTAPATSPATRATASETRRPMMLSGPAAGAEVDADGNLVELPTDALAALDGSTPVRLADGRLVMLGTNAMTVIEESNSSERELVVLDADGAELVHRSVGVAGASVDLVGADETGAYLQRSDTDTSTGASGATVLVHHQFDDGTEIEVVEVPSRLRVADLGARTLAGAVSEATGERSACVVAAVDRTDATVVTSQPLRDCSTVVDVAVSPDDRWVAVATLSADAAEVHLVVLDRATLAVAEDFDRLGPSGACEPVDGPDGAAADAFCRPVVTFAGLDWVGSATVRVALSRTADDATVDTIVDGQTVPAGDGRPTPASLIIETYEV